MQDVRKIVQSNIRNRKCMPSCKAHTTKKANLAKQYDTLPSPEREMIATEFKIVGGRSHDVIT